MHSLIIRDEQLEALRARFRPALVKRLVAHATTCHPDEAAALGDRLERFVAGVVSRGAGYGLTSERDLARLLSLILVCGSDWTTPQLRWMHDALRGSRAGASVRVHRLFQRALDKLALEDDDVSSERSTPQ